MSEKKRTTIYVFASFLFLCFVSLYRQLGLQKEESDLLHPLGVYCGYILLLTVWGVSVYCRISQWNLRRYLYGEIGVMFLWLTVRFLQEAFIKDLYLLRVSGYFICIPLVLLPLFGFYGVLGLDKGPEYRISPKWYLLLLPAGALIFLMLTNEWHHFVFLQEPEISLYFHANTGIFFIGIWAVVLELCRIVILWKKIRHNQDYPYLRFLPFCAAVFMGILFVPYFISSFTAQYELIELTAKHYFMEAMVWESCIFLGMVPVNSQYSRVFEYSTAAMRITDGSGQTLIASRYAPCISEKQFEELKKNRQIPLTDGLELCLHEIPGGYLIWQRDYTEIDRVMQNLQQTAEELQQENFLLQRELAAKSEESRIQAKNDIYDQLSTEVTVQLELLEKLLKQNPSDSESWNKIGLIGTYVKRLCNLRLTYQETGNIENADVKRSLENILYWLKELSVKITLNFAPVHPLSPQISLRSIKILACLLESVEFRLSSISITISEEMLFLLKTGKEYLLPVNTIRGLLPDGYDMEWKIIEDGFILHIEKGGEIHEKK